MEGGIDARHANRVCQDYLQMALEKYSPTTIINDD